MIGRRLRAIRKLRGLTLAEVGEKAGFSDSAATRVSQYERGIHVPKPAVTEQLAKVLDVPVAYLYANDDQLADWILAFPEIGASKRRAILEEAGIYPRK